ncbi:phage tail spike protein [Jeotgalicoccus psychrophilus]|uniref:phage tail spike protein n=1 Tax=Jeotgalicoccus psychrophilus TaxID=157228 RepID=UPI000426D325|nr:phage tail spike protein [Jeotgalicoccus psychrophilus]
MIYLFDRTKKLQKIIPRKHINSATQTKVRNGIYQLAVEVPIFYEDKKGTQYNYQKSVGKAEFAGHYDDKNRFQLYKIYSRNITANKQGEFLLFDGVHIFFDEAKAMGNIHDRRFRDSEAKAPADVAFNSIGWTIIDYDVTDRHDINFYRASVTDAWNDLISTYGVEFDYELQFDGRKIISKNIIMKNRIGLWTGQRFAYGTNVLTLTQEQDESEVYTAAVGRGRGEESGDGFGPRLEFGDIAWSKDGITKPVGQNYIELPSATAEYGFIENGVVKPRIAPEVVFEDIEDKKKLADATYYWLLENCLPKATWKTEVARIGNLKLGDTVGVLYKAAGIIKRARVEKIEYNLLDPELSKLTLGDFHHFENRQMKRINAQIKRLGRDTSDRITRIKNEWNAWIDNQFTAAMNQFEQNLIDQQAEIEADRENMTNLIEGTRTEFTDNLNTEITQTKEYAEQKAQEKADEVRTDLETVTSGHQTLIDGLKENVMDIDEFLGTSRSITLDQRFLDISQNFEERLRKVDSNTFNMIRGTRFDEPDMFHLYSGAELQEEGNIKFVTLYSERFNEPRVHFTEGVTLEKGKKYIVAVDYRSYGAKELDRLAIGDMDGYYNLIDDIDKPLSDLHTDGKWRRTYGTVIPSETVSGQFQIGTNFASGDVTRERIDIKLVYLTGSNNTDWVYHPQDATQSIEEVTRRITNLEDGYSEFVTKSLYDAETDTLNQYIKSVEQTVEGNELILQRVEDWQATNGQSVLETVDAYERKLWLNDVSEIEANLLPIAEEAWEVGRYWSTGNGNILPGNIRIRRENAIWVSSGVTYTFSDDSPDNSNIDYWLINFTDSTGEPSYGNQITVRRGETNTFTTPSTHILLSAISYNGTEVRLARLTNPNRRIYAKLERGSEATPMLNAVSQVEQLANQISFKVQEVDDKTLKQTDFKLTPDYWQLGAMRIGAEDVSSVLRGSPDALDAVVSNFNLTGNLNAKGQITSLAVDAIEGNFARLFANQLTANVITSDHIQVGTALVDKLFATSARIDELITKTHFVNEMHALTLNVVDLNASHIRSRLLTVNTIEADWIKSGTALLDRVFSSTAMFERMMAKSAFITTLSTVTLDLHELTIWRPDGVPYVQNGVPSFGIPVFFKPWMSTDGTVTFDGRNYNTSMAGTQTFEMGYTQHAGRYLSIAFSANLRFNSTSTSTYMGVVVRFINKPSGTSIRDVIKDDILVFRDNPSNEFQINVPLGSPTYGGLAVQLEFYRIGGTSNNIVQIRTGRAWING